MLVLRSALFGLLKMQFSSCMVIPKAFHEDGLPKQEHMLTLALLTALNPVL
jgi:hypothetical protein